MTDLERDNEIRALIDKTIEGRYIAQLSVRYYDDIDLWELRLYMDQEQSPLAMGYQGTYDQFKKFIETEMRTRKMERASYWGATQELPSPVCKDGDWELDWDDALIT